MECIILISALEMAPKEAIEDALYSLQHLISQYKSFIVQATIGTSNRKADLSSSLVSAKYTLHDFPFCFQVPILTPNIIYTAMLQ